MTYDMFELPKGLQRVPKPIAEANAAYIAAKAEAAEAEREAREAAAALKAAPASDEQAMARALDAGEEPPAPTVPGWERASDQAQRVAEARRKREKAARWELTAAVQRHMADYLPPRVAAAEEAAGPVRDAMPALVAALAELRLQTGLVGAALESRTQHRPEVAPPAPASDPSRLAAQYERALERKRQNAYAGDRRRAAEELPELLAGVSFALEGELEVLDAAREQSLAEKP